jgi:hypothetical protein
LACRRLASWSSFSEHKHAVYPFDQLIDREYGLSRLMRRQAETKEVARPVVIPE